MAGENPGGCTSIARNSAKHAEKEVAHFAHDREQNVLSLLYAKATCKENGEA